MKISAHCFAQNVKIEPLPAPFKYKDFEVILRADKREEMEGLILEISKQIDPAELDYKEEHDEKGLFIEKRLRPYKETLTEVSYMIEGFLSILYVGVPPRFDPDKVVVNAYPDTAEEREMIRTGKISGGFGNVFHPSKHFAYQWNGTMPPIEKATDHLAAFSFLSQAIRSQARNDQEVAFFLYFRTIEGYFSDGTKNIENALINKQESLKKYVPYTEPIKKALSEILGILRLPSKNSENYEELLTDLVLVRHKLTHFSKTNAERHHRAGVNFELNSLNNFMRRACVLILRDELGV